MISFQNGREEGASFAHQPFFLLDSQVISNLPPQGSFDHPKGGYVRDS